MDWTIPTCLKRASVNTANNGNKKKKVSRFPLNPQKHWGPKRAATGKRPETETVEDKVTNEEKNDAETNSADR